MMYSYPAYLRLPRPITLNSIGRESKRWLWVQFPWMALAGSGVGSAAVLVPSTGVSGSVVASQRYGEGPPLGV